MSASERAQRYRDAVMRKNGLRVDADDPIMVIQTMHEELMAQFVSAQDAMINDLRETLETVHASVDKRAVETAERVLNASLQAHTQAMEVAIPQALGAATKAVAARFVQFESRLASHSSAARALTWMNVSAATVSVLCAAWLLWAVLKH